MLKKLISRENVFRFLVLALVFSIPFGTKKFLFSFFGAPSEEHSAFLFGLDLGIVFLVIFALRLGLFKKFGTFIKEHKNVFNPLAGFLAIAFISILLSPLPNLAVYVWVHLVFAVVFFLCVVTALVRGSVSFHSLAVALGLSAVFQAFVAFFQFIFQRSVGFSFLGESVIDSTTKGVARIYIEGIHLLRVYGTTPHANILAGFLVIGLISLVYLWLRDPSSMGVKKPFSVDFYGLLVISVGIFFILLALVLTFSRSGWIVAIVGVTGMLVLRFLKREKRKRVIYLSALLALIVAFLGYFMWFAISPRVERLTMEDPSVQYRVLYNELGGELISLRPFGVGIGSQSIVSINEGLYTKLGITRTVDWQPIHNLYLLVTTETGIPGTLCFLFFLGFVFLDAIRISGEEKKWFFEHLYRLEVQTAMMMLFSLLIFGLFDHFLWTLESGRLMLWLAISLLFGIGAYTRHTS